MENSGYQFSNHWQLEGLRRVGIQKLQLCHYYFSSYIPFFFLNFMSGLFFEYILECFDDV